jgi:hypothetical protein
MKSLIQSSTKPFFLSPPRWLLVVAILITVLSLAPNALAALRFGDRGYSVAQLQEALGIEADGVYGEDTEIAVSNYQRRNGLAVDGIAGPETLESLSLGHLSYATTDELFVRDDYPSRTSRTSDSSYSSRSSHLSRSGFQDEGPYVVVIPGDDEDTLFRTQDIVPEADFDVTHRILGGRAVFINAGSHYNRRRATQVARRLHNAGLPARVEFRP